MRNKILKNKIASSAIRRRGGKGSIDVVVGLQWGDEGKGKNIDELLSHGIYSGVARFQGGANAGHTIKANGKTFIGHIIPSGCLQKDIELYIGNGVVVDAVSLIKEMRELEDLGFDVTPRLYISNRAKLVSYLHPFLDQADEYYRNKSSHKIGTTSRGIGPAYSDIRARRGLLLGDVLLPDFKEREENLRKFHHDFLNLYKEKHEFEIDEKKIEESKAKWWAAVEELKKLQICDLSFLVQKRLAEGKNILAEGAQAVMLDIDFGDYPNVTSSNTLPANVCLGLGIPHTVLRDIYGVTKAYTTKVGGGNFPARIKDQALEKAFQDAGHEFGATTGRPRMCGWLDLFALRHAIALSGVNKIFINKADICPINKGKNMKVVIGYKNNKKVLKEFPFYLNEVTSVITEEISGWGDSNHGVKNNKKVSKELRSYLNYIKRKLADLNVKIIAVGTGQDRDHFFNWEK
ncbi:adenylosuccinate synthase [Candidatus Nomurabacteria bacterium]|nr:adenylosuccinate synthase [Candidatus Nomurabacteria bacterium]